MTLLALRSTLFPYTTLFRSFNFGNGTPFKLVGMTNKEFNDLFGLYYDESGSKGVIYSLPKDVIDNTIKAFATSSTRSEEHTSELQSHHDLVCRLLLEKKKNN